MLPIVAAVFAVLVHLPFVWFDFDPMHDGLPLAKVIGLLEGREMHRDIASAYGPGTAWSQAIFVWMLNLEPSTVSLRYWAVAHVGLIAYFSARLGAVVPAKFGITTRRTFAVSIVWITSSSVLLTGHLMSWPTLLSATLVAVGLNLIFAAVGAQEKNQRWLFLAYTVGAGALFGLLFFVRINVGVAVWAGLLFVLAVSVTSGAHQTVRLILALFFGGIASAGAVTLYLHWSSSLLPLVEQTLVLIIWHENLTAGGGFWLWLVGILPGIVSGLGATLALFFLALRLQSQTWPNLQRLQRKLLQIFGVGTLLMAFFVATGSFSTVVNGIYRPTRSNLTQALRDLVTVEQSLIYFLFVVSMLAALYLLSRALWSAYSCPDRGEKETHTRNMLLVGLSVIGYVGVYPVYDVHHVWWGASLGLVPVLILVSRMKWLFVGVIRIIRRAPLALLSGMAVLVSGFSVVDLYNSSEKRAEILFPQFLAIGEGIRLSSERAELLSQFEFIAEEVPSPPATVDFYVYDPGLSVLEGGYRDNDEFFHSDLLYNRATAEFGLDATGYPDWVIYDRQIADNIYDPSIHGADKKAGYRAIKCNSRFCLFAKEDR